MINICILVDLSMICLLFIPKNDVLHMITEGVFVTVILGSVVLSLIGIFRLCAGLGYQVFTQILCTALLFMPFGRLLVLAHLSSKANAVLRAAGYKVGLLGAAPKNAV